MKKDPTAPIGIFDSGVGGLSVLGAIREQLPHEQLHFLADQAHVPYGRRTPTEIRAFSVGITRYFMRRNAKLIVLACNTATAAALNYLRKMFPEMTFVGMEPAVKPAAAQTHTGSVGVLATPGTFGSPRYASLMARYAKEVAVYENPCLGLVERIEAGDLTSAETHHLLSSILTPMQTAHVDTLVLGCTHYPFVRPLIEQIAPTMHIIDPAPAIARHITHVLAEQNLLAPTTQIGSLRLTTSADPISFTRLSTTLLGHTYPVDSAVWDNALLTSPQSTV